jgi:hypothetical protein
MFEAPDIPGAADVIAWFGCWPTFHDAEVLSILLDRSAGSRVVIHAVSAKHAIVTFRLEGFPRDQYGMTNTSLEFFSGQNILGSASVNKIPGGYELLLEGCCGVEGSVVCERMSVELEPGVPEGSM